MATSTIKGMESYEFTAEYSSLLAMINDQVTTKGKKLPFSFVKSGFERLTDTPSEWGNAEFTGIVYGNGIRLTVFIKGYGNIPDCTRDIFSGNWLIDWQSIHSKINHTLVTASNIFSVASGISLASNGYQVKENNVVHLALDLKRTDNYPFDDTSRIHLGTLTTGWIPVTNVVLPASGNSAIGSYVDTIAGNALILTGGDIYIDKIIGGQLHITREIQIYAVYPTS